MSLPLKIEFYAFKPMLLMPQLVRENNQEAGKTWVWTYDNAGNILSRTEYAYTTGELGEVLDTVTYGYGATESKIYKNFIIIDNVLYYYMRNPDGLYRYENGESSLIDDNESVNEFSLSEKDGKLFYTVSVNGNEEAFEYDPANKTVYQKDN